MIGYFKVVRIDDDKEIGRYKYTSVTNKQLYRLYNISNVKIFCCCGDEDIEMRISKDLRIYPAQNNVGQQHDRGCPKYIYEKKENSGELSSSGTKKNELWIRKNTMSGIKYHLASSDATASDFLYKINQLAYIDMTTPVYKLTNNYEDFNIKAHYRLKEIQMANGEILYNISLCKKNVKSLAPKKEYFVFGMLDGKPLVKVYGGKEHLILQVKDVFGSTKAFYANKEIYKEETSKIFKKSKNIIVCGFAYRKSESSSILTLTDFCVKAINDSGILVSL